MRRTDGSKLDHLAAIGSEDYKLDALSLHAIQLEGGGWMVYVLVERLMMWFRLPRTDKACMGFGCSQDDAGEILKRWILEMVAGGCVSEEFSHLAIRPKRLRS